MVKAIQLKGSSPRLDAQVALAQGMGGKVWVDPGGFIWATAESFGGWPVSPSTKVLELKEIPTAWVPWGQKGG